MILGSAIFWRIANVAPVLVSTCNFLRMFWTCFSTVRRLVERITAISKSRFPCMTQCRTSLSRLVNPSFSSFSGEGALWEAFPSVRLAPGCLDADFSGSR